MSETRHKVRRCELCARVPHHNPRAAPAPWRPASPWRRGSGSAAVRPWLQLWPQFAITLASSLTRGGASAFLRSRRHSDRLLVSNGEGVSLERGERSMSFTRFKGGNSAHPERVAFWVKSGVHLVTGCN